MFVSKRGLTRGLFVCRMCTNNGSLRLTQRAAYSPQHEAFTQKEFAMTWRAGRGYAILSFLLVMTLLFPVGCADGGGLSSLSSPPQLAGDFSGAYARASVKPGHGQFRDGFTQATIVVMQKDSAATRFAAGRLPSQYVHDVMRSGTREKSCAFARFIMTNLTLVPSTATYAVRYRDESIASVTFTNQKGFLVADVPLRDGQTAVEFPNVLPNSAKDQNPILMVKIFDQQGREAPLAYLPNGNSSNAVVTTPRNSSLGLRNDFMRYQDLGAIDLAAIVPPGFCTATKKGDDA